MFIILLACATEDAPTTRYSSPEVNTEEPETEMEAYYFDDIRLIPNFPKLVPCDETDFGEGLTLFNLPIGMVFTVSVTDDDGYVIYTEEIEADRCGTATPFAGVFMEDIGGFDDASNVYVDSPEAAGFTLYVGQLIEQLDQAPFPISTQWDVEESTSEEWVPITDPELGVNIGPFMMLMTKP